MKTEKYYKKINLVEGEDVVEVLRQHGLAKVHLVVIASVLILLPVFFMYYFFSIGNIGVALWISLIVLGVFFSYREWYLWNHNVFILTNKKVVDIDQKGLFNKVVSEIPYTKVVDVSYSTKGVINALFGFGEIHLKTSIPDLSLKIEYVSGVKQATATIVALVESGGGRTDSPELDARQKMQNFDDFLNQEQFQEYAEYTLKELIEEYTEVYSVQRLKKLLATELKNKDTDES
jgi:membrane protein YdbS with pleckstrin-like domain